MCDRCNWNCSHKLNEMGRILWVKYETNFYHRLKECCYLDRAALYWLHFLIEKYTVIDIWWTKWWLRFPADSQRISIKSACIETRKWPFCIQIKLYSRWKSEFYAICHKITANVWKYFACGESHRTVWILHVQRKYVYKFSNDGKFVYIAIDMLHSFWIN